MQVIDSIEIAILQEEINKYYPGKAKFVLQSFANANEVKNPSNRLNSMNKNNTFNTNSIFITPVIELSIPKYVTIGYKEKYIPKSTQFLVGFAGADKTKPFIIGMKVDGDDNG